ncbi:MAG TPA: redoxin domain-containing protein [Verrucomicrobiae bacterium]
MKSFLNLFSTSWALASAASFVFGASEIGAASERSGSGTADEVLNFAMIDQRGELHELRRMNGKAVVLFFTANECPIARQSASKLKALREKFYAEGVNVMMVNSSMADDRKSISKEMAELGAWHIPVLKDDTQGVAHHLGVKRTGEAIAISTKDWTVFYRGAIDDQMVEGAQKEKPSEHYLENALREFLAGKGVSNPKTVARGCLIQFEAGDSPGVAPVSYASDIAPLLERKCVNCHSKGNIGSWAMTNQKKVKSMASMIEEVLLTRRMPPWDADPVIGKFANDQSLSVTEAQTLLRWIYQGAPGSEGKDPLEMAAAKVQDKWPMGEPDLVLRLPDVQEIPATGVLDYRHIEVRAGNTNEAWVGGVWVRPSNNKVVHHIIARLKQGGRSDPLGQKEMFAGWAPGATQGRYPQSSGKFLPANAKFDFEMHYTPNGSPQTDQSEIGLYFLKEKPSKRYESVPVVNTTFEILPGDQKARAEATHAFTRAATLHSVTPHMHLRGRSMKFELLSPTGKREVVCSIPRYDFSWQLTYALAKTRNITPGTWAMLSGTWDNSTRNPANPDPKKTIHWGDQSFDEMFLGWYNVTWDLEEKIQK